MKKSTIVSFAKVIADPQNPRQEFFPEELAKLEASIKKNGILTPLSVEEMPDGKYLLVDGERRYRASKKLGLTELPVIIYQPMSETERLVMRFNLQEHHSQWTAWEKANAVNQFRQQTGMDSRELAHALGVGKRNIENFLLIASLSKRMTASFTDRKLPYEYIVELGAIMKTLKENESQREDVVNAIVDKIDHKVILSARELRKYRIAIAVGGDEIVKKIINQKRYSPTQAGIDAGTNISDKIKIIYVGATGLIIGGEYMLAQKNPVVTEAVHKRLIKVRKIIDKLVDMDYEEGRKGHNRNPEI